MEVEREPSPTRRHTKRVAPVEGVHGREDEKGPKVRSSWLLEYAFGTQMLLGQGEWMHVAHVIRSSFLVVAKELKRHERRLRVLEVNSSSHFREQEQKKESDRWSAMQTQMTRFSDELQLLTQQLQQLKESDVSIHQRLGTVLILNKRSEERHARVKRRLASVELLMKNVIERDEKSTQTRLQIVEAKLSGVTTELQQQLKPGHESSLQDVLKSQAQCEQEIRIFQRALVAHDKRAMAQVQEIEKRIAKMMTRDDKSADAVVTRAKSQLPADKASAPDPPQPFRLLRSPSSKHIPVVNSEMKARRSDPETQAREVSAATGSHATLRERFARAREKQQESLSQLRRQQQHS